jgi:putative transposase
MIAFIDDHREAHGVEPICKVLPIAPSTYHAHAAKRADPAKLSARARRDVALQADIRRVWEANFQVYGVRKVWRQLQREAIAAPRCQVARLMKRMGLAGAVRGKTVQTTRSDKAAPCPLDRVNRQFRAPAPNTLWVSDFTYVATWQGFVYAAFVIDAFARRIVGWRVSRSARADCSTRSSKRCVIAALSAGAGSCTTAIAACNISRFVTANVCLTLASSRLSAALETATTTRSPRRSTACSRPR